MFVLFLGLVLSGISRNTEGALLFTQVPGDKVYAQEGSSANLTWAFAVDNRTAELTVINWSMLNKTKGVNVILVQEEKSGRVKYNTNLPPTYGPERVTKVGQASILIKNVTFEDSTKYKCFLVGEGVTPNVEDEVELIVTGHPIVFPLVPIVKVGESATLTCNATGVPGQNITWKRRNGQNELRIINDGKYGIISSGSGSSQLTIKNISIRDHGYYVCDTSAIVNQPSSARGFLGVRSLVTSTDSCPSTNQNALRGMPTTICCPVRGFPPPDVTWTFPDGTVQKTGNTILPITPKTDDFGNYTCSAMGLKETDPDPVLVSINLQEKGLKKSIAAKNNTKLKGGEKFEWEKVKGAQHYICRVHGADINSTSLLGNNSETSIEIPHSTLNFKDPNNKKDPVKVLIEVLAIDESDVIGRGGPFAAEISAAATPGLYFFLSAVLFMSVLSLQ